MDLKGKVAIVSGSSSGIGAGIAVKLASIGVNVVITGRDDSRIANVVKECHKVSDNMSIGVKADLNSVSDLNNIVEQTVKTFGRIDIVVNSAGIVLLSPFESSQYISDYDLIMKTNIRSYQLLTHLALPYLEITKGNIINISSIDSMRPNWQNMAYCMSNRLKDVFTECMAQALGPKGIRVNSICPGAVRTPMVEKLAEDVTSEKLYEMAEQHCRKYYPLRRIGEPIDYAEMVAFLVSDKASFITGAKIPVDGGCVTGPGAYHDIIEMTS